VTEPHEWARVELKKRRLAATDDFVVEAVECSCGAADWSAPESAATYGIVFARRGCFRRLVNGVETFVDPTVVYFERPTDEQQIAHPAGGDACTALYPSEELLASLWGGELGLPRTPVPTGPMTDLRHRLLFAAVSTRDAADAAEAVVSLLAGELERSAPKRVAAGRPRTVLARRRVVWGVREALVEDPASSVIELARRVAVSPHHLSRIFKDETGETVSRYRNRLRLRLALERIADGERRLARVAADLGFADQAHLARVVRNELGTTPSQLREGFPGTSA
jgi:AraC-like DNA-binding protein